MTAIIITASAIIVVAVYLIAWSLLAIGKASDEAMRGSDEQ